MAEFCCTKLTDPSLSNPSRFLPLPLPLTLPLHITFSALRFSPSSSPRFSKPSSALILAADRSSATSITTSSSCLDIVSSTECVDGSIVFRFGDVDGGGGEAIGDSEAKVEGEESFGDDVEEELEGRESSGSSSSSSVEQRNGSLENDYGAVTAVSLSYIERAGEDSVVGEEDSGNSSGVESARGNAGDSVVAGYRGNADDAATGLEFGGIVDHEKEFDSVDVFDGMSNGEVLSASSHSEHGVVTELCHRPEPDDIIVDEVDEISPNVEQLQLSLRVERSRSFDSEMVVTDAPGILQGVDDSAGNAVVGSDPVAVEILSTPEMPKVKVPAAGSFLSSGAALLLHPTKALTGVEDAYFLTPWNFIGVADGAAQWSLYGTHAGCFAWELMRRCENIVPSEKNDEMIDVKEVLKRSVAATQSPGLAAVLVAHLYNQVLHVANIGDTGFCLIRNGCVCKRSAPMVHEFNFPVRIGQDDDPLEVLQEYHVDVEDGDVIVVATDGLFDNVYETEIASIVSKLVAAGVTSEEIAKLMAARAQEAGRSATSPSPFADAAKAMGYWEYGGGKLDAVSVIVSLVQRRSTS